MKKEIENLYVHAVYDGQPPNVFADNVLKLIGEEEKEVRTSDQNRARWKYLSMVANILNNKGFTFEVKGFDIPFKWTKDRLYEVYWTTLKDVLYPGKKGKLNTGEFCNLVDHLMILFAQQFEINIPFPNYKDYIQSLEAKEHELL